jgi:hypothetical protein
MKRVIKSVDGNSSFRNIQGVTVTHNLNNTNPYIFIKEKLSQSTILTKIDFTSKTIIVYGLRTGIEYIVTIIG